MQLKINFDSGEGRQIQKPKLDSQKQTFQPQAKAYAEQLKKPWPSIEHVTPALIFQVVREKASYWFHSGKGDFLQCFNRAIEESFSKYLVASKLDQTPQSWRSLMWDSYKQWKARNRGN